MKKIFILTTALLISLLCLSKNVSAAEEDPKLEYGVQNGVQTTSMSIDEGLEILGYNPGDFKIKETLVVDENYKLTEKLGNNGVWSDGNMAPVEFLGVTESYEYTNSTGYIDSYIYFYTPYRLDLTAYSDDWSPLATSYFSASSIMLMLNDDKMKTEEDYEGYWINIYGNVGLDFDLQNWNLMGSTVRYFVTTDDEAEQGSVSEGVTRICFRVYTDDDLKVKRNYYIEKYCYSYDTPEFDPVCSSAVNPSFNVSFSAIGEDGEVDSDLNVDPGYSDSTMFTVNRKSVVCVEAEHYIYNWKVKFLFWDIKKAQSFIVLRNKKTGEIIDNLTEMQIIYKLEGDNQYREAKKNKSDKSNFFTLSQTFGSEQKTGKLSEPTKEQIKSFKEVIIPKLSEPYPYSEMPQYLWMWNYNWLDEVHTVYVWYEVEAGSVVQGSCYESGLHVEYDEDGNALGVFDGEGNQIEDQKFTQSGVLINDDGSYRLPENSEVQDVITEDDEENTLDKILEILDVILTITIVLFVGIIVIKYIFPLIIGLFTKKDSSKKKKKKK